jgi:hypothetical protein
LSVDHGIARRSESWRSYLPLVAIACIASLLCLLVTRHHVGFDTDSAPYLGAAYNFAHGRGLTTPFTFFTSPYGPMRAVAFHNEVPLTHFPPLYSAMLGTGGWLGLSLTTVARLLNSLLFGVNIFLAALVVLRLTNLRSRVVAGVAAVVLVAGPGEAQPFSATGHVNWLTLHSSVMSEPLFLAFALSSLLLLDAYLQRGTRREFWGMAAFGGLAALTRYVGVSVVLTAIIAIIALGRATRRARLRDAALCGAIGIGPLLVWNLYTTRIQHGAEPRVLRPHSVPGTARGLLDVIEGWLLPSGWSPGVRDAALAAAVVLVVVLIVAQRGMGLLSKTMTLVLSVFALMYMAVVLFSRYVLDASIPLDSRILAPLQLVLYALVLSLVWSALHRVGTRSVAAIAGTVAIGTALVAVSIQPTSSLVRDGYRAPPASDVLDAVRALPHDTFIASNGPETIFLQTGRSAIEVPLRRSPLTTQPNRAYAQQLRDLAAVLQARRGVLVLFPTFGASYLPTLDELSGVMPLEPAVTSPSGTLYRVR